MKILFYTNAFDGGGAEIVFARLANALADAGHQVIFAADHAPQGIAGENPRYERLPANHAGATRALAALLRRERPEASFSALGAHNMKHLAAAAMAGRMRHCVLGIHGFAAAERKAFSQVSYWASPLATRLAARTICVSDALRHDMIHRWHADADRLIRIYNPVVDPTTSGDARKRDDPPLVLACGRLVALKRFPDLVGAFADAAPRDARLAILGEGPERPAIEAAIRHHHLEHRVDLPGHVDPAPWYPRASCLAVTSQSESFGLTIAEALAHGVPVVSTDCGGPREILGDGRYGRLVPINDRAALATALSETLATPGDPALRIERAQAFALTTIRDAYLTLAEALR